MPIRIEGAREHNLADVDVTIGDGLTVVTGVSGSGKTSLVFDTVYHELFCRFKATHRQGRDSQPLAPADVRRIEGLGPAVAVGQNLLNRNPESTLATASGLHPYLRLLYAHFGTRHCGVCDTPLTMRDADAIVERLTRLAQDGPVGLTVPLLRQAFGSHRTLLSLLREQYGQERLIVDGEPLNGQSLDPALPHSLSLRLGALPSGAEGHVAREALALALDLGGDGLLAQTAAGEEWLSDTPVCPACGAWFHPLRATHFHQKCPHCQGEGCERCGGTGLHPEAAAVRWQGLRLPELLERSVQQVKALFEAADLPTSANRLLSEVAKRLAALDTVGLGYIALERPSPTLSRGESQRVRLAVTLTSPLEDMLHVLDEPTIGQHPADVARLMPAFRQLKGPVLFVEHDRAAAAYADQAIDIGPGAGSAGGEITFKGTPQGLWQADTPTGRHFSLRERVRLPEARPPAEAFLRLEGADLRNLRGIDVAIPLGCLTVITGVSGAGKSTLVEGVLLPTLKSGEPVGCAALDGPKLKPTMVDQKPIGRNPRSNPATYTKLSDRVRDLFARATGLSASHFSFNRPEGACPTCKGIGAIENKMRFLPSTWIPCADCEGRRFSEEVLAARVRLGEGTLSIADFYDLSILEARALLLGPGGLAGRDRSAAKRMLDALCDVGLGYLTLGQPSPSLSGGEAQRVKLAKYLGRRSLKGQLLILDEPSTGLHPQDIAGLLVVLDRLVRSGATVVIVEHNTDLIRAADWIIDLGPGAGPDGGLLLYQGEAQGLMVCEDSLTAQALREEASLEPTERPDDAWQRSDCVSIRGARAHNLRDVSVDIPKHKLTVVTGVSGSGKSSLVGDVLESEARRRFLESLSMYERQSTREGAEAPVESVRGLGVALSITQQREIYSRRGTVGSHTEIVQHLAVLLGLLGERDCPQCGSSLERRNGGRRDRAQWLCADCGYRSAAGRPIHFSPRNYAAACPTCHGVGTLQEPRPEKLMIHPEKPICGGAMYSPGFFPGGYLCKTPHHGHAIAKAVAARHGFDLFETPWEEVSEEGQRAFLFGDSEPLDVEAVSNKGVIKRYRTEYPGFYGWVGEWDIGGTYTDAVPCPDCSGGRLRPEYASVTLRGHNRQALCEMPLWDLAREMDGLAETLPTGDAIAAALAQDSLSLIRRRLGFLRRVGLGYLHLDRPAGSLSAGEAQRVRLAGLMGSGLTALTLLIDEPTRGMHPSEVEALRDVLHDLRDEGHTLIVVEHDPSIMRAADHLIDMGPQAGSRGGQVVAQGSPQVVAAADTITGRWLRAEGESGRLSERRTPRGWMTIRAPRENNLQGQDVRLPLGCLVGVCGVSGSGKSTLIADTLGRAIAPRSHTTSVASEPITPGMHDAIEGAPERAVVVDQAQRGIQSAARYLDVETRLLRLYGQSEDAQALGYDVKTLKRRCATCSGRGALRLDMGFMPNVEIPCESCGGSGYPPEAWEVRLRGQPLPALFALTLEEVLSLFADAPSIAGPLHAACDVGLGYLVLRQPGFTMSGGESQRIKIARELSKQVGRRAKETLYILDEPTIGQHLEDVARLSGVLHRLVDAGHSVLVVEHHTQLLANCDWLLELGPGGGPQGGRIIAEGAPEQVAAGDTPTAPYLRQVLAGGSA